MGICRFCNTKAGLFKDTHESCTKAAKTAQQSLTFLVTEAITSSKSFNDMEPTVVSLRTEGRLSDSEVKTTLLNAADKALLDLAIQSPLSNDDAERIGFIFQGIEPTWFSNPTQLVNWPGYVTSVHSNSLYEVLHGQVPYHGPEMSSGFVLRANEHPIVRRGAVLAEYKTTTSRTYGSVSVPIGGGMYYRLGAAQPRSSETALTLVDQGMLLITTQAIYFGGARATFRTEYSSILRLDSFNDAVGVYPDHGTGKVFIPNMLGEVDDGWYFYNLISALAAQSQARSRVTDEYQ